MAKQVGKAKRISEFAVKSLVGGMNIATDPMDLKETEAKVIENMEFDAEGSELKTRRGVGKPSSPSPLIFLIFGMTMS